MKWHKIEEILPHFTKMKNWKESYRIWNYTKWRECYRIRNYTKWESYRIRNYTKWRESYHIWNYTKWRECYRIRNYTKWRECYHIRNYTKWRECYRIWAPNIDNVPVPVLSPLLLPVLIIFLKLTSINLHTKNEALITKIVERKILWLAGS